MIHQNKMTHVSFTLWLYETSKERKHHFHTLANNRGCCKCNERNIHEQKTKQKNNDLHNSLKLVCCYRDQSHHNFPHTTAKYRRGSKKILTFIHQTLTYSKQLHSNILTRLCSWGLPDCPPGPVCRQRWWQWGASVVAETVLLLTAPLPLLTKTIWLLTQAMLVTGVHLLLQKLLHY